MYFSPIISKSATVKRRAPVTSALIKLSVESQAKAIKARKNLTGKTFCGFGIQFPQAAEQRVMNFNVSKSHLALLFGGLARN